MEMLIIVAVVAGLILVAIGQYAMWRSGQDTGRAIKLSLHGAAESSRDAIRVIESLKQLVMPLQADGIEKRIITREDFIGLVRRIEAIERFIGNPHAVIPPAPPTIGGRHGR